VDVDLIGWVGVGLGGTYGCRCGFLYVPMLGLVFFQNPGGRTRKAPAENNSSEE